jgi:hypothetical protein
MKLKVIFILTLILIGYPTYSQMNTLAENNQDVSILAILIQDHLRKNHDEHFNLNDLILCDTLKRIWNNFKVIELKLHGGYIAVNFKFSNNRVVQKIDLSESEQERTKNFKWIAKDLKDNEDGEIQFEYGERYYWIRKIVLKK